MIAGTAQADNHASDGPNVYTSTGTVQATVIGGVGPKDDLYTGAKWSETLSITSANGDVVTVTGQCVGMSMPDRRPFERHVTCDLESESGSKGSVIMGCNPDEDPTHMRCMGTFEGKEGGVKDRASLVTAFYMFNDDGSGTVQGSGHWMPRATAE